MSARLSPLAAAAGAPAIAPLLGLTVKPQCYQWGLPVADNLVVYAVISVSYVHPADHVRLGLEERRELWKIMCDPKVCKAISIELRSSDRGLPLGPTEIYALDGRVLTRHAKRWVVAVGNATHTEFTVDFEGGSLSMTYSGFGTQGVGVTQCPDPFAVTPPVPAGATPKNGIIPV